jgi:hypothetical protein
MHTRLYREFGIAPPTSKNLQTALDIRSDNRDVASELPDGNEEISEENEQAVQFNQEPGQGPAEEDEEDTGGEGGCSLEFLGAGEEDQCFLDADDEGQADQEEDLGGVSGVCVCSGG